MTATSDLFTSHLPGASSYDDTLHARAAEELDLLLVGSRATPAARRHVGASPGRLVREAACPVIVLPRSAGHIEKDSLFERPRPGPE